MRSIDAGVVVSATVRLLRFPPKSALLPLLHMCEFVCAARCPIFPYLAPFLRAELRSLVIPDEHHTQVRLGARALYVSGGAPFYSRKYAE